MINSLAFLLLLLLAEAASSRFSRVVEAVATTPAHVSGGAGAAAEGAATAAGSEIAAAQQPPPVFDVDDALAAIRAQAAAGGGGTPLSPAAAATAGRTAMASACGPGLGRCTLVMGGCCSERGTCGWECRGACQALFSAPGFCSSDANAGDGAGGGGGGVGGTSVSSAPPPPASSLPLVSLGSPCGAYLARCAGSGAGAGAGGGERGGRSCCSVLGFCVAAPSPLCSSDGDGNDDSDESTRVRTTRRFRLVATRGEINISAPLSEGGEGYRPEGIRVNGRGPPLPPPSLSAAAGDRVVVEFVNALEEPSGLHFHGVRWRDRANEDGAAGLAQRAVAAGGIGEEGKGIGGSGGSGGGSGDDDTTSSLSPLPPPVFVYDFVAGDPGTYWWHSHVKVQAADGLRGTLVVRGGEGGGGPSSSSSSGSDDGGGGGSGAKREQQSRKNQKFRARQPEATLFVGDWYGAPASAALGAYLSERNSNGREPTPDAVTINGRSWWWWRGSGGGGGGADNVSPSSSSSISSPSSSSSSLPPPPPIVEFSDPQGDYSRRGGGLALCSEPRDRHALVRVVNGGTFATVAVSFAEAAAEAEAEEEAEEERARPAAAAAKSLPRRRLRATVVAADAVPTVPTLLDPARPLRLGVGQRHDVELCALLEKSGGDSDGSGGNEEGGGGGGIGGGGTKKNKSTKKTKEEENETEMITSVWAVAVADGALFDAPMRLSNATAAVLRFGGGGRGRDLRFLPPEGVDLSDAGAAAAAPPAFSSALSSSSSSSSIDSSSGPPPPAAAVPSPEPTVFHQLTISFNKQQNRSFVQGGGGRGGGGVGGVGGRKKENSSSSSTEGPSYFVEGFSQRPRGLDDPRKPSLLEAEKERAAAAAMRRSSASSSSFGPAAGGDGGGSSSGRGKEEEREERELTEEWNLLRHPLGSVVEMRVRNDDDVEHSWHLHGHNFWVVAEGKKEEEDEGEEGKSSSSSMMIAEARDTVLVPPGTAVTLRYVADSPGAFLAHCHMGWHEAAGLAAVMVDGVE